MDNLAQEILGIQPRRGGAPGMSAAALDAARRMDVVLKKLFLLLRLGESQNSGLERYGLERRLLEALDEFDQLWPAWKRQAEVSGADQSLVKDLEQKVGQLRSLL